MQVNLCSEPGNWILPKCARVIRDAAPDEVRWNENYWLDAEIRFSINYGYFDRIPGRAKKSGAFFCHYSAKVLGPIFIDVAKRVDFCVAMSEYTKQDLLRFGIPEEKITVIELGVDPIYKPRLVLGVVGRTYDMPTNNLDTRKGRDLLHRFAFDPWVREHVVLRIMGEGWGLSAEPFQIEKLPAFYAGLDYLLCTSDIEGGPVPLLEALACGVQTIIPPIGYAVSYPAIHYNRGSLTSLVEVVQSLYLDRLRDSDEEGRLVKHLTWERFAQEHWNLFRRVGAS